MSGDTPEIVLNEFGDLSRKARRELEARGIDPDTAVVEYIAATGQMPVITPEAAAAAKAQAQAEAAAAQEPIVVEEPISLRPTEVPVEVDAVPASVVPPVSVPVTSAETGPIEPLTVAPALDSSSLSAVEETLAAVSDQTGEILTTGFDSLVSAEATEAPAGPSKGEARRLARKEKKAQAVAAKQEKAEAALAAKTAAREAAEAAAAEKSAQAARDEEAAQEAAAEEARLSEEKIRAEKAEAEEAERRAEAEALRIREEQEAAARVQAEREAEEAQAEEVRLAELAQAEAEAKEDSDNASALAVEQVVNDDTIITELDPIDDEEYDEEEFEPQTISEATAAIAIAEAVAAAEAVVEAGEVSIDNGNLANAVPATTGSISVISNALILPTLPETTGSIAPINPTGEIVITGSILIPSAVSQVGAHLENLDTSEIDIIKDDEEVTPTQGMTPVSAATAVSAYNISNSVVTTPRGMNDRLPFILSITAAGLAVGVVALFVAGYFLGLF